MSPKTSLSLLYNADFLLLLDAAVEYPLMIINLQHPHLGDMQPFSQIPTLEQLILQVLGMVFLDRLFLHVLPVYPEAPVQDVKIMGTKSERELSPYNVLALEYLAPKMALTSMLCGTMASATARRYLGGIHVLGAAAFLFLRILRGGVESYGN